MSAEPTEPRYTTGRPADIDGVVDTFMGYRWPTYDRLWRRATRKVFFTDFARGVTHLIRTRCWYAAVPAPKNKVRHVLHVGGSDWRSADIVIDVGILIKILNNTRRFEAGVPVFDVTTKSAAVVVVTKSANTRIHARSRVR